MTKLSMIVILSSCLFACGKKDDKAGDNKAGDNKEAKPPETAPSGSAAPAGPIASCAVGTYEWDDNGKKRGFVLNADGTGKEIYEAGKDERPLTWTGERNRIKIVYSTVGDQVGGATFDMPYDCDAGTFGTRATPYKKK
jgi:hypothetical protein